MQAGIVRGKLLELECRWFYRRLMKNPFRHFKTSSEIFRLFDVKPPET